MNNSHLSVGVVIIGRNEGLRLIRCLESLSEILPRIVYVDSGSTDNSLKEALNRGAYPVSLDMTQSFTAARARNAGFYEIIKLFPDIQFVQFVDGDCVVNPTWISIAYDFLKNNSEVAVVCGRRREVNPDKSIYNKICDDEWNTPIGQAKSCGGDALMRVDVFKSVGGYKDDLIAGEEPELCIRIRQAGYTILRLDAEMTLHDAAMTKFSQWWKRSTRAGYAFAEGAYLHGAAPENHWVAESKRALIWGIILPLVILLLLLVNSKLSLLLLLIYPAQLIRLAIKFNDKQRWKKAFLMVAGKFAEATGQLKFYKKLYLKEKTHLIEYK